MTTNGTTLRVFIAVAAAAGFSATAAVYTVQPGETLAVTDATVGDYADGLAFADATGVVEFNTSAAPTMPISGAGTVRKTSAAAWTMTTAIPDFTGAYDLAAGATSFSAAKVFGADDSADGLLYVRDGATLSFKTYATAKLNYRTIRAAGRGVDGRGALEFLDTASDTSYGQIRNLVLDDDALINFPNGGLIFVGQSNGIDLNGHNLHLAGKGTFTYLQELKGDGEIVLEGASGKVPVWGVRAGTFAAGAKQAFRLSGYAKISVIENTTKKPNVPIYVTGVGNTLAYSEYWNRTWEWNTNGVGWAGAIAFTNAPGTKAELTLDSEGDPAYYKQFTVAGPISGPGTVKIDYYHKHRVCFAATNNTFTGGLYVGGYHKDASGQFCALHPGSLPAYSSITCEYGHVDASFLPDAENPWTGDEFVKLSDEAVWQQGAFALMDVSAFTNGVPPSAAITSNVTMKAGIGANGPVSMTGTTEQGFPDYFGWKSGEAIFSGPRRIDAKTFRVENGQVASVRPDGVAVTNSAVVTLDGGVEFVTGSNMVCVGCAKADAPLDATARLVVKDAFLHTASTNVFWPNGRADALVVGCGEGAWDRQSGVLEVRDGAVVSNKLHVSGGGLNAGEGGGRGLVIQKGGTVYALGATKNVHYGSAVGMGGHGAYDMRGGAFTAFGSFMIGGYASGVWRQSGGEVSFTNYPGTTAKTFGVGYANGGWGTLDMTGGRFRLVDGEFGLAQGYNAGNQRAMLSIRGEGTYFGGPGTVWRVGEHANCNTTVVTVANGAVVQMGALMNAWEAHASECVLAFDDGTLRTGFDDGCLFGCENSYVPYFRNFNPGKVPSAVLVYAGGMTLDTAGFTGGYSSFPFTAPKGGGVTGVLFTEELTGAAYVTVPEVVVEGDGHGACAVALYDADRGAVTGIEVTCPGEGYTQARARLCYFRGRDSNGLAVWFDCTVGPNAQAGGFTKTGAGDFTLKATNTWGGALAVAGGTLKCGCDKAIPDGRALTLSGGGVLDLNGQAVSIASVVYGPGGGAIVHADAATIPAAFGISLSVDDLLAGRAVAFTGDVDLSSATVALTGGIPEDLDPAVRRFYALATTDGAFAGTPAAFVSEALPPNWRFVVRRREIRLACPTGMSVMIR